MRVEGLVLNHLFPQETSQRLNGAVEHVVSFNVQTLKGISREMDVHSELSHASVLCLQGTREMATYDNPVRVKKCGAYTRYIAGYSKSSSNHAGVSISLRSVDHPPNQTVGISFPKQRNCWGRGLAVRSRRACGDFTYVSLYIPPSRSNEALACTYTLLQWLYEVVASLPNRAVPVICADRNGRTGLDSTGALIPGEYMGEHNRGKEDANGRVTYFPLFMQARLCLLPSLIRYTALGENGLRGKSKIRLRCADQATFFSWRTQVDVSTTALTVCQPAEHTGTWFLINRLYGIETLSHAASSQENVDSSIWNY